MERSATDARSPSGNKANLPSTAKDGRIGEQDSHDTPCGATGAARASGRLEIAGQDEERYRGPPAEPGEAPNPTSGQHHVAPRKARLNWLWARLRGDEQRSHQMQAQRSDRFTQSERGGGRPIA
jgi:hypothetical protein